MLLPPLVGETGQVYAGYSPDYGYTSWVITDKCKNPEVAIALYNYLLDPFVLIQGEYGDKGLAWDDPDPGTQSFLGTAPLYKLVTGSPQEVVNNKWYNGGSPGLLREYRYGQQADDISTVRKFYETWDASLLDRVANNPTYYSEYYWIGFEAHQTKNPPASLYIQPLVMDDTDSNRVIDITAILNTYRDQTVVEFITGTKNINSNAEWNAYLSQLNQLGAAELVALYQKYMD
jgi:putative aldouronate transport system substrate-binding protein